MTQPGSLSQGQPPTDDLGRSTAGRAAVLLAVAAAHQRSQNSLTDNAIRAAVAVWNAVPFRDLSKGWNKAGPRIFGYVSAAQELVAAEAAGYVQHALSLQGISIEAPGIVPSAFAGYASDGRSLEGLLVGTVVSAKKRATRGGSPSEMRASGTAFLTTAIRTEISDAARMADHVAIVSAQRDMKAGSSVLVAPKVDNATTTVPTQRKRKDAPLSSGTLKSDAGKKVRYGWVRMLQPPSCGRCAMLAGKFFKWNDGFERHECCDCKHIPVEESTADDITVNPYEYFKSLSIADQEKYFGVANSAAISAGADINQVMNASLRKGGLYTVGKRRYTKEGTAKRGFYRKVTEAGKKNEIRPTPWQIVHDSHGDQALAVTTLRRFGYIIG